MPLYVDPALIDREAARMTAQASAPAEQDRGIGWGPYAALAGGNVFDTLTTVDALRSGRGKEGNPLLGQNPAVIAALKLLATVPEALVLRWLGKDHPTVAKALGYGIGGLGAAVGARNLMVGR